MLTHLIDSRARPAAATLFLAGILAWFGIIHSPLSSSPINPPAAVLRQLRDEGWSEAVAQQTPYHWAAAYSAMAITVLALARWGVRPTVDEVEAPKAI
jgi:adenine/guanine/hypoxanthine permease